MKLLVTGGAGFIGRWLLCLLPSDVEVVVVDRLEEQVHGPNPDFPTDVRTRATCIRCDVRDVEGWKHAAGGTHVVVHLAALNGTGQSMHQQSRYIEHNVIGTSRLFDVFAQIEPKPRRVTLASSRAVYGEGAFCDGDQIVYPGSRKAAALAQGHWEVENSSGVPLKAVPVREDAPLQPISIYGMTKMWQEQLLSWFAAAHGFEYFVFRMQNVYGPLQSLQNPHTGLMGALISGITREGKVELFEDGQMSRDFVFVGDVARALVTAISHQGQTNCTLNFGSGKSVSLAKLVQILARLTGRNPIVSCGGRYRLGDVRHASADMTAYEAIFGPWQPVTLGVGLAEYVKWFLAQPAASSAALAASVEELATKRVLLKTAALGRYLRDEAI